MMADEKNDVEIEAESHDDSEMDYTARKPRSRERGPDKKPRTYKANSMSNLVQFNQQPEEFAKYLKEEKGVDIAGNSGIVKIILILGLLGFAGIGGWWLYKRYKNGNDDSVENRY